ncbi:BTAD domain-containing putative transcriptional regulator [Rugosimonospora acidiphila]|uniref:BTAD domain-containing putative transcriptional regulator n=1 Tax=Rugosimonospora acidiphila TaxID=556531 RepID=A0ABP9SKB6_9ACTN
MTVDRLVDLLWPGGPPASARGVVQSHISALRRTLSMHDADRDELRIDTAGAGYLLRCDPDSIDAHRFSRLVAEARSANDDEKRAVLLDEALALWRGPALAGAASQDVHGRLCRDLDEARLGAIEDRAEALVRLGNHRNVAEHLAALADEHPDRPRLTRALMLALHGSGRTAQALDAYQRAARHLRNELGLEPTPELQDLQVSMLRAEPNRNGRAPATVVRPAVPLPIPRQLPADIAQFTGRQAELRHLLGLSGPATEPGATMVAAIDGMAGVGKTTLAVRAAHQLAPRFPDGQVFVDLHGYTENIEPADPIMVLETLLRTAGVDTARIPASLDERAALWRTHVADKRLLLVLDNGRDESQVAPLLPGSPLCLVIVTSRRRMVGLDRATPISLDVLSLTEAVTLLSQAAGSDRMAGSAPATAVQVADWCGRLPLAIRIASARLRHHPGWTADHLLELLRGEQGPLATLHAGQRSITAALNLSYQHLTEAQQRLYRRLGLHPGPNLDSYAAAALLETDLNHVRRHLDELYDAHLLTEPRPGRYVLHDLVRHHMATAVAQDPAGHRSAALGRLFDHYAYTAANAVDRAHPYEAHRRPHLRPPGTSRLTFDTRAAAEAWLDTELSNIFATVRIAAEHGRSDHILRLSAILHRYLHTRADDARDLHGRALAAARSVGDHGAELRALVGLGLADRVQGRYEAASDYYNRAVNLARRIGEYFGELEALCGLARIHSLQGRRAEATQYYELVLDMAPDVGDRVSEVEALNGLGQVHQLQNRSEQAMQCHSRALDLAREIGDRTNELHALQGCGYSNQMLGRHAEAAEYFTEELTLARDTTTRTNEMYALIGLGRIHQVDGRYERAADCLGQVLAIAHDIAHPVGQLNALVSIADAYRLQGDHQLAADHFRRALDLARDIGSQNDQFEALQGLGRVQHITGHPEDAMISHTDALHLATGLEQPADIARARDGLGHAEHALGHVDAARRHWQAALELLTANHISHTDDPSVTPHAVRDHLAQLTKPQSSSVVNAGRDARAYE